MGDIQADVMPDNGPEYTAEPFTGEGRTHCEWSERTKENLIESGEKWQEAISFNLLDQQHRKVVSDLIDTYNERDAYQLLLARSKLDTKYDTKDIAYLMYKSLLPSKS